MVESEAEEEAIKDIAFGKDKDMASKLTRNHCII